MAIQPKATDTIKVNAIEAKTGTTLSITPILLVDVIKEKTGAARTTLFHGCKTDTIVEKTASAKVDFPDDIKTDVIAESTSATGVTIDGLLIKDSNVNKSISGYTPSLTPTNITTTISEVVGIYSQLTNNLMWFEVSWKDVVTGTSSTYWIEDVPLPTPAHASSVGAFEYFARQDANNLAEGAIRPYVAISWGSAANARVTWYSNPSVGTWRRCISGIYRLA